MFSQALLRRVVTPRRYIMIVLPIGVCALHSHLKDGAFHSHFTHISGQGTAVQSLCSSQVAESAPFHSHFTHIS